VVIVDASPDEATRRVVGDFEGVTYLTFSGGAGHMTTSRNIGLLHVEGEVIAFLDDDTVVHKGWLVGLQNAFGDPSVSAVAGRTCNARPGEDAEGVDAIGRLLPDGRLTGFFAADPRRVVGVDHGIGANMAFRRTVLAELGGFRDDFGGVGGVREDTDVFLRIGRLGRKIVFSPEAAVDHLGAPHVRGKRFDLRYEFWSRRNHGLLLARNFGLGSRIFRRWLASELVLVVTRPHRNPLKRIVRVMLGVIGVLAALGVSLRKGRWGPRSAVRRDATGRRIAMQLAGVRRAV
jgi:GT2 family glycosyltransferase